MYDVFNNATGKLFQIVLTLYTCGFSFSHCVIHSSSDTEK